MSEAGNFQKLLTLFPIVLIAVMATSIMILHVFSGSYMAPVLMLLVALGVFASSRNTAPK